MKALVSTLTAATVLAMTLPGRTAPIPLEEDPFRFRSAMARHGMVVCGEGYAARAGALVLEHGGNAVDAAVVTAFTLAVTLPRAGNLGGGGFMLIRNPKGEVAALDFRELAPGAASRDMFLDAKGNRDVEKATIGGLCVGVPGTVAGLDEALHKYGTLTLTQAVQPAHDLALYGFNVPGWLTDELARVHPVVGRYPESARIFYPSNDVPGGGPPRPGHLLVQTDLAHTFEAIQSGGTAGFYTGRTAQRIVDSVQSHGGVMSLDDLRSYRAVWRAPVQGSYRGYTVFSMPPPSSGGIHLVQALNVLSGYDLQASGQNSALTLHRMIETLRQCYADRSRWLGDPDFTRVPTGWLTSKGYADQIRAAIPENRARRSADVHPGEPPSGSTTLARPAPYESDQTTQICTVDDRGWAVSMTYTLNYSYGSGLVADGTGVLLNNEMDDFSAAPGKPNGFGLVGGEANAVAPHKRPLSSMTPTIVERDGKLYAALGSPGGSHIITVVLQVLLNLVDFDCNAQTAVASPRIHHQWLPDQVEVEEGFSPDTLARLATLGHKIVPADSLGHAMVIRVLPDGTLEGGVDPRRTGGVAGTE